MSAQRSSPTHFRGAGAGCDDAAVPPSDDDHSHDHSHDHDHDEHDHEDGLPVPTIDSEAGRRTGPSALHGAGVFATRAYAPEDVIERCPVLVLAEEHEDRIAGTAFDGYCYTWDGGLALALGFGSLYNHSTEPNARYWTIPEEGVIEIVAHRPIAAGDEILVNYNGDPDDATPVWFDPDDDEDDDELDDEDQLDEDG